MRRSLAIGIVVWAATGSLSAQQPAPVFRAGIDVLTLEASVVDAESRPVADLSVDDFAVTIDGSPRRVVSARYVDANRMVPAPADSIIPSHSTNQGTPAGRVILFAVDRDAIASGNERTVLNAATTMLDALGPGDAAGATSLPQGSIELTRDKDRVRAALLRMTGTRPMSVMQAVEHRLSWDEALAYENNNSRVIAEAVERECRDLKLTPERTNPCPGELRALSLQMLLTGRGQFQQTMAGLRAILDHLSTIRGTKHLVLLSGGLPFGQDLLPLYDRFAREAAAAEVVFHAVHLDAFDDVVSRRIVTSTSGGRDLMPGLANLASMTGGAFYQAAGSGLGIFSRITSAMSGFYQLGVETTPADRGGAAKPIEVRVPGRGLTVRYGRRTFKAEPMAVADRLASVMQQPIDSGELPIAVATYTVRGDEASTLRVLIAAEFAQLRSAVEWGFTVFNEGNAVASGRHRIEPGANTPAGTQSAKLLPGQYRLRVGAVDGEGRSAALELPLSVGLRAAGDLQFSDVIVGAAGADGKLEARSSFAQGETMWGLGEILSADTSLLERTRAVFEIAQAGASEPIKRYLMAARSGGPATIVSNQAEVSTAALPPGIYVATMIPLVGDQPVGRVSRRFEVIARP